jgi:hypothetical protein
MAATLGSSGGPAQAGALARPSAAASAQRLAPAQSRVKCRYRRISTTSDRQPCRLMKWIDAAKVSMENRLEVAAILCAFAMRRVSALA